MEFWKLFPTLLLDLISKIVPGSLFLLVFRNRYIPPTEFVQQILSLQSLPAGWLSWYRLLMILATSYVIGIFIAILADWFDGLLISRYWFNVIKKSPDQYIYPSEQPSDFAAALANNKAFSLFVDHCRSFVEINATSSAAMLEKYRTAFRLFVGLSLLFLVLPVGLGGSKLSFMFLCAPISGFLAFFMSKRYLCKSIQYFSLSQVASLAASNKST